ncbi:MAG: hypothetical protein LCH54_10295 [Bacteroidetes bacterium]|nr:hypothetical protein [Bacteroidota bacterium]
MKKVSLILIAFSLFFLMIYGCAQLGTLAGGLMTQSTANLADVSMQVSYMRNLYPDSTGEIGPQYAGEQWKNGANVAVVNFLKRSGIGTYTIDGTITLNGDTLKHFGMGAYSKLVDLTPQTFKITTKTGQTFEATVAPIEPVKIKSVSGGADNVVDFAKPLTITFDNKSGNKNDWAKISLLSSFGNVTAFTEVATFKIKDKVTFPAEIWQNQVNPIDPNTGPSYLLVERFQVNPIVNKGVGALQVISKSWDCVPVTVTGDASNAGLEISEDKTYSKIKDPLHLEVNKPSAYTGKPFSRLKKVAITSLTVNATKLTQTRTSTSSTTNTYGNTQVTTTTTTVRTRAFPKFPEAFWDNLVDNLYKEIEKSMKTDMGLEIVPIEKVLASPSYAELEPIPDEFSKAEITKTYKGTKNLLPTTLSSILKSVSSTFASDRIDARLLRELNVDGLMAITVDLEMPWFDDAAELTLQPRLSFRITGGPNGYSMGPTVFAQGVITGMGQPFDEAKINSGKEGLTTLESIVRRQDLVKALKDAIAMTKAEEAKKGYDKIWKLQD